MRTRLELRNGGRQLAVLTTQAEERNEQFRRLARKAGLTYAAPALVQYQQPAERPAWQGDGTYHVQFGQYLPKLRSTTLDERVYVVTVETLDAPYRRVTHARQVQPQNGQILAECRDVEVRPDDAALRRAWPQAARQAGYEGDVLCRDREGSLYLVRQELLEGDLR